jgi:purine-binding chemotaxis protein CheW
MPLRRKISGSGETWFRGIGQMHRTIAGSVNWPYVATRPGLAVTEQQGGRVAVASSGSAYLLLDVAGTACALPRGAVAEVLPLPDLHNPPTASGWLAGFLNLGGVPVPVIDLAALLGLRPVAAAPGLYAHLVLMQAEAVAYLVDRASDLVTVPEAAIRPTGEADTLNGCVAAELVLGERLVHALAPERLLTAQERIRIEALARVAAERLAALPAAV